MMIIVILCGAYITKHFTPEQLTLFPGTKIKKMHQRNQQLQTSVTNLRKEQEKKEAMRLSLTDLTADYWPANGKLPVNEMQLKIERLGQKTGVTLNTVSAPKTIDINDHVRAIDISISATTTIRDIAAFLEEIDQHQPRLFWINCVLRPDNIKSPSAVSLSGTVRAYLLNKEAAEYLAGNPMP